MKKWFWGVFFLLAAAAIIISQVGDFQSLGLWTTLMTVVLLAILVQSIVHRAFGGVFVPLAILYWVYQDPLGWPEIHFWVLIIAAVFVSIGLSFFIRKTPGSSHGNAFCGTFFGSNHGGFTSESGTTVNGDENHPSISSHFGATTKYLRADALESCKIDVSFGAAEIYFQDVTLHPNGAEIYINCRFSGLEIYIPRDWNLENNIDTSLAAVNDNGVFGRENAPRIRLSGNVSLSGVEIKRV